MELFSAGAKKGQLFIIRFLDFTLLSVKEFTLFHLLTNTLITT